MAGGPKSGRVAEPDQVRLIFVDDAHVLLGIESLPPKTPRGVGKSAKSQISFAGFEFRLEMPGLERHRAEAYPACFLCEPGQQRRQKHQSTDVGDQKAEAAIGRAWIEPSGGRREFIRGRQEAGQPLREFDCPWGELHPLSTTDEQRVTEVLAKSRQNFADRGLGSVEELSCPRKAPLAQDDTQSSQIPQPQIKIIPDRHEPHSTIGMADITTER